MCYKESVISPCFNLLGHINLNRPARKSKHCGIPPLLYGLNFLGLQSLFKKKQQH